MHYWKNEIKEREYDEKYQCIELSVHIPHGCASCRRAIAECLEGTYIERVEFSYPLRTGTIVTLVFDKEKYPNIDFIEVAVEARERLERIGYHVF